MGTMHFDDMQLKSNQVRQYVATEPTGGALLLLGWVSGNHFGLDFTPLLLACILVVVGQVSLQPLTILKPTGTQRAVFDFRLVNAFLAFTPLFYETMCVLLVDT